MATHLLELISGHSLTSVPVQPGNPLVPAPCSRRTGLAPKHPLEPIDADSEKLSHSVQVPPEDGRTDVSTYETREWSLPGGDSDGPGSLGSKGLKGFWDRKDWADRCHGAVFREEKLGTPTMHRWFMGRDVARYWESVLGGSRWGDLDPPPVP